MVCIVCMFVCMYVKKIIFRGRFCLSDKLSMTITIKDRNMLRDLVADTTLDIRDCFTVSKNCVLAVIKNKKNDRKMIPDNSSVVGAFTLSYARLWLYQNIQDLSTSCGHGMTGANLLYMVSFFFHFPAKFILWCFYRTLIALLLCITKIIIY